MASTFVLGTVATFVPLYVGLALPLAVGRLTQRKALVLSAVSSGIIFWFFLDVMGDSSLLGVNEGFKGDYAHGLLVLTFAFGFVLLFILEGRGGSYGASTISFTYRVAALVALGISFHSFGEGMDIGSVTPGSSSIINAIGGVAPGAAYVIHKILEGFVIGVFGALAGLGFRKLGVLGVITGVPTILGFVVGLSNALESTYFFALGGAAAVYIQTKLVPSLQFSRFRVLTIVSLLVGFYLMYFAGLLHG